MSYLMTFIHVLMLLPGTFGVKIGNVRFSISGCLTLLRAPIFVPSCPDVISFMNVRNDGHVMSVLERLRELAFHHWCLQLLVAWGPLLQQFLESLLLCWPRNVALITANAYSGCDVDFVFLLLRSSVMCLRGHHSLNRGPSTSNIDLACSEGRLESGGLV